ncbi:MAG: MFS transporter [Dehalococcoidia bacterium]|nr:MFS transporter [Dehalococcoidia bacterium]
MLGTVMFTIVFNSMVITPVLADIAGDLSVSVSVGGLLVTVNALVAGVMAVVAAPLISRIGRRHSIVLGMVILSASNLASVASPDFLTLLATRAIAGLGAALLAPAVFVMVGDYFSYEQRGRAIGLVMTGASLGPVLGLPAGAVLADAFSWRAIFLVIGALCALFAVLLYRNLPKQEPTATEEDPAAGMVANWSAALRSRPVSAALLADFMGFASWYVVLTFMGAFFREEYGLSTSVLGLLTVATGLGIITGSNGGGRLGDRLGKRPIILVSGLAGALFGTLLTTAAPWPALAMVFLFAFAVPTGARMASSRAVLTELSPPLRTTIMGINTAGLQFGVLLGSLAGALAIDWVGYAYLGPTAAAFCLLGTLAFWLEVPEVTRTSAHIPTETAATP